ncbi:efflux RND transporter periplasmic adaptor subunit [Salmonella enterica subsp. enterica serovar Champaign]|nr:efflux RND transporter periplasmic adaptor subunit [Salmonella enterica subsp. enterica serovar Champaign]
MSRNSGPVPLVIVLFISMMLTGCDNPPLRGTQPAPEVGVVTLRPLSLPVTTELPGRTRAYRIAEVRPQVSGIILKRNFVEGSDIRAGVSLYQIDPARYQATYEQAKGDLAKALAAEHIARLDVKRYQPLLSTHYISQQAYDNAVATLKQTTATVMTARAAMDTARINLTYTKVTSPISGRIGKSSVTEGALVQSGQEMALATVQQLDPIYVDVAQSSDDFLHLKQALADGRLKRQNGRVAVMLVTGDGVTYPQTGTLEFTDVTVDQTTGSVTLHAIFPNPDHVLLPGMFVRAKLDEGINPDVLLVPQQGVSRTPRGEATAMVVDKNGKVDIRQIVAPRATGDKWLVTAGLSSGDRVIVTGLQKVHPGMQVIAQEKTGRTLLQGSSGEPSGLPPSDIINGNH